MSQVDNQAKAAAFLSRMGTLMTNKQADEAPGTATTATTATDRPQRPLSHTTAKRLLADIPADLPYDEWIRVAAALKHEGISFEVFDKWSQTAPDRYDEKAAKTTWESVDQGNEPVTAGTLHFLRDKYVPFPEMLAAPATNEERREQLKRYLSRFPEGAYVELVPPTQEGRPWRSLQNVVDIPTVIDKTGTLGTRGAWISLNALRDPASMKGSAASDGDVAAFDYVLVEADELSRDEQWQQFFKLPAVPPVAAAVWSGGKSIHWIVKIDAGHDRELYKKRVAKLYYYLDKAGFPADRANKNASRLTRIPGVTRTRDDGTGDTQYVLSWEAGCANWDAFEEKLKALDRRSETSAVNGQQGGRPAIDKRQIARDFITYYTRGEEKNLIGYDGDIYVFEGGKWVKIPSCDLKNAVNRFIGAHTALEVNTGNFKTILDLVIAQISLEKRLYPQPPFCIESRRCLGDVRAFSNGVIPTEELLTTPPEELAVTPYTNDLFVLERGDYAFDAKAECPLWLNYLNTTLPDPEAQRILQQIFAYVISGKTAFNQMFFFLGPRGSGKSTCLEVLSALLGEGQVGAILFKDMASRFNTRELATKSLNAIDELPVNGELEKGQAHLESFLKTVTGGALIKIEAKYKNPETARARARCIFCGNDILHFTDRSEAIYDRTHVLCFNRTFRGTQEEISGLKQDLKQEAPGILNWALRGIPLLKEVKAIPMLADGKAIIEREKKRCCGGCTLPPPYPVVETVMHELPEDDTPDPVEQSVLF